MYDKNVSRGIGTDKRSMVEANAYGSDHYIGDGQGVNAWMEIWDYSSGCSFRAFVGGKGDENTLFAFFDSSVGGRGLKQGYILSNED